MAVLVWIHGGGNVDGESNDYDGSKLATGEPLGTPTVVGTINYRLNLFGFLAHPALDSVGHLFANYGILDQQALCTGCSAISRPLVATPPGSRSVANPGPRKIRASVRSRPLAPRCAPG